MEENTKPRWFRRTWVVATVAGLIGIGIGAAAMTQDVTATPEYKAVAESRDEADKELDSAKAEVSELEAQVAEVEGDIPAREEAVAEKEAELKDREAAVKKQEKSVRKREKAVGIVEREIESNTISGDGIFEVGRDLKPGTYKSSGSTGCYYAIMRGLGGGVDDIVDNNNIDGPAIVNLSAGQFFEVQRCADWELQR